MKNFYWKYQDKINTCIANILLVVVVYLIATTLVSVMHASHNDSTFNEYCNKKPINRITHGLIIAEAPIRGIGCWLFKPYEE